MSKKPDQLLRRKKWPYPKDTDGKHLCRCGCGQYPVRPRLYWFSDACVEKYRLINDPAYITKKVLERDKGCCAACGLDTVKFWKRWMRPDYFLRNPDQRARKFRQGGLRYAPFLVDKYKHACMVVRKRSQQWRRARDNRMARLSAAGWTIGRTTPYDCDHIVPVAEGGGQTSIDNYQLLCHPCHKRKTAEQAKRRAAAKANTKVASQPVVA